MPNVQTATNKLHQANMACQLMLHHHTVLPDINQAHQALADTQTADMKNQPNTNSNMMFKMKLLHSISDTKNNAKEVLPLADTTFSFPMVANR
jgi:hypothetical protein